MKSVSKFILATLLITIVTISAFGLYSLDRYHDSELTHESIRLESCIRTFWQLLSQHGNDFRIVDNRLMVGSYVVNGNNELPDRIQDIFGGVATVFMGNERVSTNVLTAEGKRAIGTKLVGPAYEAIFTRDRPYRGRADILGIPYMTAYDPITDKDGKTIGVLFVGVKESDFLARLHGMKNRMTVTLFSMLTVLSFFIVLVGLAMNRIEKRNINQINFQRTLMDTIPNPIFYKDTSYRYLGCNRAFEEYVGCTQQELIGKTPHEIWQSELADEYLQQDQDMFSKPGIRTYEASVMHADGQQRDVIFYKGTFTGKEGTVAGLVGVILDITERKAAEAATKSSYHQLLDIIEFLPDATFVIDRNKRVIAWNQAIENLTGIRKQDILGKGDYAYAIPFYNDNRPLLIDLLDPEMEQERIRFNYTQIKQEGQTLFTEVFVPAFRNGGSRYFWATATPLYDGDGNQVGGIESIRDITEYKQAEHEKLRLQSQVAYASLMETIMIRLGHDLKTPLTPLFILLPLLRKQLSDPDQIKKVETCIKSASTIRSLADKIGILARLSSNSEPSNKSHFSLASLADQSIGDCAAAVSQKQITCRNLLDPDLAVHAVQGQMRELFNNLISNAAYFSNDHGTITISGHREGCTAQFSIHDDGIGIAADHLEHVFDEFFKADESRHNLEASGLGLSICKRIVQKHHGRIWAESPGLGQGTTIHVIITDEHFNSNRTEKEDS